jgi:hypothetical protein
MKEYFSKGLDILFTYLDGGKEVSEYIGIEKKDNASDISQTKLFAQVDKRYLQLNNVLLKSYKCEQNDNFIEKLSSSIKYFESKSEKELKEDLESFFLIKHLSVESFLGGGYQSLNKINHGYWEYTRLAYGGTNTHESMRSVKGIDSKIERLNKSGVTAFRCWQLSNYDFEKNFLGVSLNNGTIPYQNNIRDNFTAVQHGAAVGLLSVFSAAVDLNDLKKPIVLYDACITRNLIFDETLALFSESLKSDYTSCLFFVPPHLSGIKLRGFSGSQYEFIIPSRKINEAFLAVTATFLGYLQTVIEREEKVIILAQGASIATLIGMIIDELPMFDKKKVRFMDLGRVLDIVDVDKLEKQNWTSGNKKKNVSNMHENCIFSIERPR